MNFSKSGGRLLAFAIVAALARPAAAATITVNSNNDTVADDGQCTLREAITAANDNVASGSKSGECAAGDASSPGAVVRDVINFAIGSMGTTGAFVLRPATPLPVIIETVFIDGYSQTGAAPNTRRSGGNAVLMLDLRGDLMAPDCDPTGWSPVQGGAFQFIGAAASGSRLRGFAIGGFKGHPAAVVIHRAGDVQIDGNFIGFGADGKPQDNDGYGVVVMNGAFDRVFRVGWESGSQAFDDGGAGNLIGGRSPQERNVIGSNKAGVFLAGQRNRVEGNYIGVNPAGDASMPNRSDAVVAGDFGLVSCQDKTDGFLYMGNDNTIGGISSGAGNFFSAEASDCAVRLRARGNHVEGNLMGTDRDGHSGPSGFGLGAQPGCGVFLAQGAEQSRIAFNTIAFNAKGVVAEPTLTTTRPPSAANDIYANSIFSNVGLGIDLANDGVTANDGGDADAGPNGLHNFPERLAATPSGIRGVLMGAPDTEHRVDFYRNASCNPSGQGDGEKFLGSTSVLTDSSGKGSFSAFVPGLQVERFVTATATSVADGTSEFSQCVMVRSGIGAQVEVRSSRNPALSHDKFQLTVLVRGSGGAIPTGVITLVDPTHTTTTGSGQTVFHTLATGTLTPSTAAPDTAELLVDSKSLRRQGSEWGNVHIRAQFGGDPVYAAASSADFVQAGSREKSDLDGDGLTDVLLCSSGNDKFVVTTQGGSFAGPFAVSQIDPGRTVLGTAELGFPPQPAVVWSDASGAIGATTFSFGSPRQDFDIPLPSGLVVEALGSMYGDLKDDLVVRDASGQLSGVLTSSFAGSSLRLLAPWAAGSPTAFEFVQVGDFNGDGNLDWLLRDPASMRHVLWLLDGAFRVIGTSDLGYVPAGGRVAETGDFNGDGRSDIVWRLPSGDFEIVIQDGAAMRAQTTLPLSAQSLTIVGTAFLDDGTGMAARRSSLVVRGTTSGRLEAWINTAVSADLPIFGQVQPLPTGGRTDLTVCGR